jgi:DNA-binding transcriptional regulator YiaG
MCPEKADTWPVDNPGNGTCVLKNRTRVPFFDNCVRGYIINVEPLCGIDWQELRRTLGVTQAELASICRVSPRTIRRWESRKNHVCPSRSAVALLVLFLQHPRTVQIMAANGRTWDVAQLLEKLVAEARRIGAE